MKKDLDINGIIQAIKRVLPKDKDYIALHEPKFAGEEWAYVKECLDTGWVSSVGKFVDLFEERLADYTGVKRAVAVVSGTAALHICLMLVGVTHGEEVLIPALTFVATANAVTYCGAIPHFVDCEEGTLGLDPVKLETYLKDITEIRIDGCFNKTTGRRIRAVVPMHTFGHPVDMDPLVELCGRYKLELVEDAAESLGSYYKGLHTGNWGRVSALSFNGNKIITTGGGGAIITNDDRLATIAKHITTTARTPHKWAFKHDMIGYNYRLPNLNAALGCAQVEQLPEFVRKKRLLASRYRDAFRVVENVRFFVEPEFACSNYWLNAFMLEDRWADKRDTLLEMTNQMGIMTRPAWILMSKLDMFRECPKMELNIAESLERRLINIPSSSYLGDYYV